MMSEPLPVHEKLACFGIDQPPSWGDLAHTNKLCRRCQSADWGPASLYLSIADEYNFYPRVQLYASHPKLHQVVETAHAGCHLCTLILTCLLSMRYRYSVGVDPLPENIEEITDSTVIEVNVEGMAKRPAVYLTVSISNQRSLLGWRDMTLPITSVLPGDEQMLPSTLPAPKIACTWLENCMKQHDICRSDTPTLPRRVINLTEDTLRLEEAEGQKSNYATLSYVIGGSHLFSTTTKNIKERKAGFSINNLPQTAKDAVWWARQLGLKYLWLDSLCILQDSLGDWETELSSMAEIYQSSTVTIAATRASNAREGCLPSRCKLNMIPCQPCDGIVILPEFSRADWIFSKSLLDTRAWTLQEVHLSTRVLRVGGEEIAWQCRTCKMLESAPNEERVHDIQDNVTFFGSRPLDAKYAPGDRPFKLWYGLVQNFARRSISFPEDRLPAFSGMAQRFEQLLDATYIAGLWKEDLHRGLVWRMSEPGQHVAYRAPSWSWASTHQGYLPWNVWLYNAEGV